MTTAEKGLPSRRALSCRRRRTTRCIEPQRERNVEFGCMVRSDAEDHDFGGFDEGGGTFAGLEAEFARGVGGDERGDLLFADAERNLGEEGGVFCCCCSVQGLIWAARFVGGST